MPSWELFEKAPDFYKKRILPFNIKNRIAVEAGITMGWERYVGDFGKIIGRLIVLELQLPGSKVLEELWFYNK